MQFYLRLFFACFLLSALINASGQYRGGLDDGLDFEVNFGTNLSGNISSQTGLYRGSLNEGSTFAFKYLSINGENVNIYSGNNNEGSTHTHNTFSVQGEALEILYMGDKNEGSSVINSSQTLSGTSSAYFYSGGFGEGHNFIQYSNLLNALDILSIFSGGTDDGFTQALGYGIPAASTFKMFEGNFDEGSDNVKYSGSLDLSSQNLLYLGGIDDGFTVTIESAIIISDGTNTITEKDIKNLVKIYPNPLIGQEFYVQFMGSSAPKKIKNVALYSINGTQQVIEFNFTNDLLEVRLKNKLKPNTYIISISENDNKITNIKLMVR